MNCLVANLPFQACYCMHILWKSGITQKRIKKSFYIFPLKKYNKYQVALRNYKIQSRISLTQNPNRGNLKEFFSPSQTLLCIQNPNKSKLSITWNKWCFYPLIFEWGRFYCIIISPSRSCFQDSEERKYNKQTSVKELPQSGASKRSHFSQWWW